MEDVQKILKRLKQRAARGSRARIKIEARVIQMKKDGLITQDQCNYVLGITTSKKK